MTHRAALDRLRDTMPGCVFSATIDLDSATVSDPSPASYFAASVLETLPVSILDTFESAHMVEIEDAFRDAAGADDPLTPYFEEMVAVSGNKVIVCLRTENDANIVLFVIVEDASSAEAVLDSARAAIATGSSEA